MRRLASLLLAGVLVLGACGDDDSSGDGGGGDNGSESTASTSPTNPDVESRLLTANAFPDDWEEVDRGDAPDDTEAPGCFGDEEDDRAIARASASFVAPQGAPQVDHEVSQYEPGEIEDAFADGMAKLDECDTLNLNSGDTHLEGTVARLADFPGYGDESAAWQVTLEAQDADLTIVLTVSYVRKGDFGMSLVYTDVGAPDLQELEQYTALAAAKL